MSAKRKRFPWLPALLAVACLIWGIRSLWVRDIVAWQSVEMQRTSVVRISFGIDVAQLGLGVFHQEELVAAANRADEREMLESTTPGLSWQAEPTSDAGPRVLGSFARWIGFGFDREFDGRPESFTNFSRVRIPLWLLALFFAIRPGIYVIRKRANRATIKPAPATIDDPSAAVQQAVQHERWTMKSGLIAGIVMGVVLGAIAMFFIARRTGTGGAGAPANAPAAPPGVMAGNPIVGMWRLKMPPIVAHYDFKDDATFSVRFTGVPTPPNGRAMAHEAGGTWSADGKKLVLRNTRSDTPFVVVGEEESAGIVSTAADKITLLNVDRKSRNERLTLERAPSFTAGACDRPPIVGNWMGPSGFQMELNDGGALLINLAGGYGLRDGQWMQQGNRLRLRFGPTKNPGFANERRWDPRFYDEAEEEYEIYDLSSDGKTLRVKRVDIANGEAVTFNRTNALMRAPAQDPSRRQRGSRK